MGALESQPPYRGVEIIDAKGSPIGEFDRVSNGVFVEEKSARGLGTLNPRTGRPAQTAQEWVQKQLFDKTDTRIQNLAKASATRSTAAGTPDVPSLREIQSIRQLQFQIDTAPTPELEAAVNQALARLGAKYPEWSFSVIFVS
ncbi:hypothetical protein NUACC21_64920 [Scytonema sp. NUACC21]